MYDDYAHNPAKVAAAIATARERTEGRVLVLFQPHLYSRTRHVASELGRELAAADVVAVADVYPAREQPVEGVTGKLVVDALAEARPGFAPGWTPLLEDGARFVARRARPGDLVLTVGAGDVDRAPRAASSEGLGVKIEEGVRLGAADDGRDRRAGSGVCPPADAGRAPGFAGVGGGARLAGTPGGARLEPGRRRRRRRGAGRAARG